MIDFDDLPTNLSSQGMLYGEIPQNYQGLVWTPYDLDDGWNVNNGNTYKSAYKNSYDPPSLNNFVSNSGASVAAASGALFNFEGAYFSAWAQNNAFQSWSARNVTVNGYNGSSLVGSASIALSSTGYTWLQADFQDVTRVEILGGEGKYWIMDNFTIPEPATIGLLAFGTLSLVRRKRKA